MNRAVLLPLRKKGETPAAYWNRVLCAHGLSVQAGRDHRLIYVSPIPERGTHESTLALIEAHNAIAGRTLPVGDPQNRRVLKYRAPDEPIILTEEYLTALNQLYFDLGYQTALGQAIQRPRKVRNVGARPRPDDVAWDCEGCRAHTRREDFERNGRGGLTPYCKTCAAKRERERYAKRK